MPSLRRTSDAEGEVGAMVEAIRNNPETQKLERELVDKPRLGWAIKVGSVTAGTYSKRDWWMTTPVTEILEEDEGEGEYYYCKFRTGNSVYEYWAGNCPTTKFDWWDENE